MLRMINILSLKCGLAFAPYIGDSLSASLEKVSVAWSIKQGGAGFVMRSQETDNGSLVLVHQNRTASLTKDDLYHYQATIQFRSEHYDVARTSDEVVLATINEDVLLSHPQSEIWLSRGDLGYIVEQFQGGPRQQLQSYSPPEWLSVSTAAGRLLISDQRSGRWVLLSAGHIDELERRSGRLSEPYSGRRDTPPVISVKGIEIHLQFAFGLLSALESFAGNGTVSSFSDRAPDFRLIVSPSPEGLAISDGTIRAAVTRKEAPKWAALLREGLESLNAVQMQRSNIRTVFADGENGRWVLQWGDEICLPPGHAWAGANYAETAGEFLAFKKTNRYSLVLNRANGNCVALSPEELQRLVSS